MNAFRCALDLLDWAWRRRSVKRKPRRSPLGVELLEGRIVPSAGELDPTFGTGGIIQTSMGPAGRLYDMVLQPDGKIIGGGTANYNGGSANREDFGLARFNADGTLDTTFGTSGKVFTNIGNGRDILNGIALQSNGMIVAVGHTGFSGEDWAVARYDANGVLDTSFGVGGIVITNLQAGDNGPYDVAIQSDGKIVVVGASGASPSLSTRSFAVVRYNIDGSLDTSFGGGDGYSFTPFGGSSAAANKVLLQPDGKIVLLGHSSNSGGNFSFAAVRYLADGSQDASFGTNGVVQITGGPTTGGFEDVRDAVLLPDGKIVAGCNFWNNAQNDGDIVLIRLTATGQLDTTYGTSGRTIVNLGSWESTQGMALQPDGKVVAVGASITRSWIGRFNADGTLDTSFGPANTGTYVIDISTNDVDNFESVLLLPNEKILAGGWTRDFVLARFEAEEGPVALGVNTLLDNTTADAFLTLREAITVANARTSTGVIAGLGRSLTAEEKAQISGSFGSNENTITIAGSFGSQLQIGSALPDLNVNVRIQGNVVLTPAPGSPDFALFHVANGVTATLANLQIQGWSGETGVTPITNAGNLTLEDCYFSSNSSTAALPTDYGNGGTINNQGTLTVLRSSFFGNGADRGGAIFNAGTATIVNSTFAENLAARGGGGAIANQASATLSLINCTIADNDSNNTGGGGIHNAATGIVNIVNTIVAGNRSTNASVDLSGAFTSQGHNLIGNLTGSTGWLASDIFGDARFGPTIANNSHTPVLSLQANSPAIDRGNNAFVTTASFGIPATDQRKLSRIADGDNSGMATVDIGAFEFQKYVVSNGSDSGPGSMRDAVTQQNLYGLGLTVLNPSVQTITLTTGAITIDVDDFSLAGSTDNGLTIRQTGVGGILSVNRSRVSFENMTFAEGNSSNGGAIIVQANASLTLDSCTLANNDAGQGGALFVHTAGSAMLTNCTLATNAVSIAGGALFNLGTATLINCTLADNSAAIGGGIHTEAVFAGGTQIGGFTTIRNTIVGKNAGGDINGAVTAESSFNLIGYGTNLTGMSNGTNGNRIGTSAAPIDPRLAGLSDNQGPTMTMALQSGSLATHAGTTGAGIPADDQRGYSRDAFPDIGAFEEQPPATLGVNTLLDNTSADALLTLREAITVVNAGTSTGVIQGLGRALTAEEKARISGFLGSTNTISIADFGNSQLQLSSVLPDLNVNVRIQGPAIITPAPGAPAFILFRVANGVTATLANLQLSGVIGDGAVRNDGNLTVEDCSFLGKHATVNGGAIYNLGTLTVLRSNFLDNFGNRGGAIFNAGTATLMNSTFVGNQARLGGGAIANETGATLSVFNCTIAFDNHSNSGASGIDNAGTTYIANTIVAGTRGEDFRGSFTSLGHNLLRETTGSTGWHASDIIGDPMFGPFTYHEESPFRLFLRPGSPAIDGGDNAHVNSPPFDGPATDRRKLPRISDGDNNGTATVDIGAYEFQKYVVTNGNNAGTGSLREAVQQQNDFGLGLTVLDPAVQTITLTSGAITVDTIEFALVGSTTNGVTIRGTGMSESLFIANKRMSLANLTLSGGRGDLGGAIYVTLHGRLTLDSCTFTDNEAQRGGAIFVETEGAATLINSTLANNDASLAGGALFNQGTVTLINSTLADNTAPTGGGIHSQLVLSGGPGPIRVGGFTTIRNTIVARNAGGDINGSITSESSFNLVGYGTNLDGIANGTNANRVGTSNAPLNPLLMGLSDNGGPTLTMALLPGSLAIDAGTTGDGIPTDDQRGSLRLARRDIGAYEVRQLTSSLSGDFNGDGNQDYAGFTPEGAWLVGLSSGNDFVMTQWAAWSTGWTTLRVADFNGDGKDDIAGFGANGTWWVGLSNGASFTTTLWATWSTDWVSLQIADFDGDGKDDVAGFGPNGTWWVGLSNGSSTFTTTKWAEWFGNWLSFQVSDFNGDGRDDVAGLGINGKWWVGITDSRSTVFDAFHWATWSTSWLSFQIGDYNGDGKADIAGFGANGTWWVALSTGTTFNTSLWATWSTSWASLQVADFDGDGKSDLAGFGYNGTWWVGLSDGTSFNTTLWANWLIDVRFMHVADFTGDGKADAAAFYPIGTWRVGTSNGASFTTTLWDY